MVSEVDEKWEDSEELEKLARKKISEKHEAGESTKKNKEEII